MKVKKICPVCQKEFYLYPCYVRQGIKCCSNKCKSKFVTGSGNHNYHGGSITSWGYKQVSVNGKKVYEHRYVMEQFLGRKLKKGEEVHHINGDKLDNRIENLEVLKMVDHKKHHRDKVTGKFVSRIIEREDK